MWSGNSLARLKQLHPKMQDVAEYLATHMNLTVVTGYRSEAEQLEKFNKGLSKVKKGYHNHCPSLAVDLQPYPVPEKEQDLREMLSYMAGLAIAYGASKGYDIRWGGDWNENSRTDDNDFDDLYHLEIRNA